MTSRAIRSPQLFVLTIFYQWAGKTIALGTFPSAEADEKCARAKALTRAWRSTMRPKPSRDWVMVELERLGVRVVSGRLGRKAGEEDEPVETKPISGEFGILQTYMFVHVLACANYQNLFA